MIRSWASRGLSGLLALLAATSFTATSLAQEARFQPVAEGTLDTQTGLVWGFSFYETGEYLRDAGIHEGGGTFHTWLGASNLSLYCEDANGDPIPGGFCTYPEFSNWYADRNDTDWRLPTRDEFVAAAEAGLIDAYDVSPREGFQTAAPYLEFWTSTRVRERGRDKAYLVEIGSGVPRLASQGAAAYALAVRGVAPPPEEPTKGNGRK